MSNLHLFFRQLFDYDTWTYTDLLADTQTREAALIDTVKEQVKRDLDLLQELDLKLKYVMETHVHADHVTGANDLREATDAKGVVGFGAHVSCADIQLADGAHVELGPLRIRAITTPGHTDSCMSYYTTGRVFTGDALLVRGTGRTDFQQGSSSKLYDSITQKLFTLPPDTLVYPAHDYHGMTVSTIEEERKFNPRIGGGKTKEEFIEIMKNLNLPMPKKIQVAVPANLACGNQEDKTTGTIKQG